MLRSVTYGQLNDLLLGLGFTRGVVDGVVGYKHKATGSFFQLHDLPPDTPARESDYAHIRSGLYWQGLMERDEFEEHFALLFAKTHSARTKQA
jgi:hypothetical protein